MEKSAESPKKQWSLFQAFCCGPKATKKRSSPPQLQHGSNALSPRQIVASESIHRNSHNQTSIAMRQTAVNEDNLNHNNIYQHGQDIEEDNQSHLSSHKLPTNLKQHPTSQLQNLPSNHIVNIKPNSIQHHRQASQQYEPPSQQMLKSLQQQQLFQQQQQQLQQLSQQPQQISSQQSQSFHRRAFSNVNPSGSNLRQINDVIIHEVEPSLVYSQQSQRLEDSHQINQSIDTARRQQQQQFYTMENQFFKLKTRYAIHEIDFVENRPQDKAFQSYFTFDCPICFRHFNKILKSDCCDHYLCHYCLRDIYNKAKDSEKDNFKYRCMFCQLPTPLYLDADCAADKIKRYSDSPFIITPKEQTAGGNADAVQPFNIHLNNLIEFADDNNNSIDKENNNSISHHNEQNFVNNSNVVSNGIINKPPLPHLSLNQKIQPPQQPNMIIQKKEKNPSFQENENVHQSAHKPAGQIPEFQNKYHCNYLQNNGNSGNNQQSLLRQQQQQQQQLPISQGSSLSISQSTSIKLFR